MNQLIKKMGKGWMDNMQGKEGFDGRLWKVIVNVKLGQEYSNCAMYEGGLDLVGGLQVMMVLAHESPRS